jgi:hypothetical protein
MGFRTNKTSQITLNDRLNNLTERERRFLNNSWAKPFGETIFPLINEEKFEILYCNDNGRPNTPVNIVIGSLLLKELTGITDEELVDSVILDPRYQYALHLTNYDEIPYSDRTPSRFRERLYLHELETGEDLLKEEIERLGAEFAKLLKIKGTLKRMDSLMVSSSCKKMGRLELMYTCISNLLKARIAAGESSNIPENLHHYADVSDKNAFCYRLENEEVTTRLEQVTADALLVYELCAYGSSGSDEYQLLERMLFDQTKDGKLKPNHEIKPTSLQNPSDEDATYRKKTGKGYQGYVANIVESCGENVNIITEYDYAPNVHSDIAFAAKSIDSMGKQDEKTVLITDGAYASEENMIAAAKNNIELVPTALTGKETPAIINEFVTDGETLKTCPAGQSPLECSYNKDKKTYRACFDKQTCISCPRHSECIVVIRKTRAIVNLSCSTIERARYQSKLSTERYKAYARKRNGVEGMPSVLRRKYRVDEMPVRGLVRSKMWFGFKIGAINIKRVIAATVFASVISFFSLFFDYFRIFAKWHFMVVDFS